MKESIALFEILKKISYFISIFAIVVFGILSSIQKPEKIKEIQLKIINLYQPFSKLINYSASPILKLQSKQCNNYEPNIKEIFTQTINQKSIKIQKNIKNFNYIAKDLKYDLILIKPIYYSSSGILTDVIFAKDTLLEGNVMINLPIISENGLFGRISAINKDSISIITIFNEFSNIPVYTEKSSIYGIASGNGSDINFIYPSDDGEKLIDGEVVFTSKENNLITAEIPVGTIKKEQKDYKIIPFANQRTQILGIIK
jgi:cell shape-determining protein MreC